MYPPFSKYTASGEMLTIEHISSECQLADEKYIKQLQTRLQDVIIINEVNETEI